MATATYTWGTSGAPPDPPWTEIRSGLSQTANTIISTTAIGSVKYNLTSFGVAQYSQSVWKVNADDIFNGMLQLYLRIADISNYFMIDFQDGRHDVTITSRIVGTNALKYTVAVPAHFVIGDVLYAEITAGNLITLKRNGVTFGSYDASLITELNSGNPGIGLSGTGTDMGAWGDWGGGDLGGAVVSGYNHRSQVCWIG